MLMSSDSLRSELVKPSGDLLWMREGVLCESQGEAFSPEENDERDDVATDRALFPLTTMEDVELVSGKVGVTDSTVAEVSPLVVPHSEAITLEVVFMPPLWRVLAEVADVESMFLGRAAMLLEDARTFTYELEVCFELHVTNAEGDGRSPRVEECALFDFVASW